MTDNEIIKALDEAELFLRNRTMDGMSLKLNEYDIGILRDISQVCAKAYDEINRQKAKIERLMDNVATLTKSISELTDEVGRQRKDKEESLRLAADIVDAEKIVIAKAKSEARKEFAERLKEKPCADKDVQYLFELRIDNLLKEMERANND